MEQKGSKKLFTKMKNKENIHSVLLEYAVNIKSAGD